MSKFLPFDEALAVAQSLGLANQFEWQQWCKEGMRPPNVPSTPGATYKGGGWQGWVHWLGSSGIEKPSNFVPFGQALAFAHSLGLGNMKEWKAWCKEGRRPPNVPSAPDATYKGGGWQGWGHWLGTVNQATKNFLPFVEAQAVAQSLGLASTREWKAWNKEGLRPANVPSHPNQVYVDGGWQGWSHWLGIGSQNSNAEQFLSFSEARTLQQPSFELASNDASPKTAPTRPGSQNCAEPAGGGAHDIVNTVPQRAAAPVHGTRVATKSHPDGPPSSTGRTNSRSGTPTRARDADEEHATAPPAKRARLSVASGHATAVDCASRRACAVCGKNAQSRCPCCSNRFCDRECQKLHWRVARLHVPVQTHTAAERTSAHAHRHICAVCGAATRSTCPCCGNHFCGRDCQKRHWPGVCDLSS